MNSLKFLKYTSNSKLWFFSDPHFSHSNLCIGTTKWDESRRGGCRDFLNPTYMDDLIIDNINSVVGDNDTLYCLGDWCFASGKTGEYRNRINCKNLHLILGNHDKDIRDKEKEQSNFSTVRDYHEFNVDEKHHVIMSHYPIESWNRCHGGSFHLFGHQHSRPDKKLRNGRKLDVGLDGNDFMPYSWKQIYDLLKDREMVKDF